MEEEEGYSGGFIYSEVFKIMTRVFGMSEYEYRDHW